MNFMMRSADEYVAKAWTVRRVDGEWFAVERGKEKPRARGPFHSLTAALDAPEEAARR